MARLNRLSRISDKSLPDPPTREPKLVALKIKNPPPQRQLSLLAITIILNTLLWSSVACAVIAFFQFASDSTDHTNILPGVLTLVSSVVTIAYTVVHTTYSVKQRALTYQQLDVATIKKTTYIVNRLVISLCVLWLLTAGWNMILVARRPSCLASQLEGQAWEAGMTCLISRVGMALAMIALENGESPNSKAGSGISQEKKAGAAEIVYAINDNTPISGTSPSPRKHWRTVSAPNATAGAQQVKAVSSERMAMGWKPILSNSKSSIALRKPLPVAFNKLVRSASAELLGRFGPVATADAVDKMAEMNWKRDFEREIEDRLNDLHNLPFPDEEDPTTPHSEFTSAARLKDWGYTTTPQTVFPLNHKDTWALLKLILPNNAIDAKIITSVQITPTAHNNIPSPETNAWFVNTIDLNNGILVAGSNHGPVFTTRYRKLGEGERFPELMHWSDIAYLQALSLSHVNAIGHCVPPDTVLPRLDAIKVLNYVVRCGIENVDTNIVIHDIIQKHIGEMWKRISQVRLWSNLKKQPLTPNLLFYIEDTETADENNFKELPDDTEKLESWEAEDDGSTHGQVM
ncbi:hypothetical protein N0V87_007627 [Didymella glomerata]|uniref:Uncharacterized protein n=1 Tax=Didymella glomerata TaxID=749621 RepID=A0A9W8WUV6_9PLEO|nr:hypothetical protein N0V87_007627 [Didymella glomerata]